MRALIGLGRRVWRARATTVLVPSLCTATAFAVLAHFRLVGRLPAWELIILLGVVSVTGELCGRVLHPDSSRRAVHAALAAQVAGVTVMIYAIGWGPTLIIGYLYGLSGALDEVGSWVWRPMLGWTVVGVAAGQLAIAGGVVPTYVKEPYVHGIAVLGVLGAGFVMRLLGTRTGEVERASSALQEALSLVTATLESTADGLLVVGADGQIMQSNSQFAGMWRLPGDAADTQATIAWMAAQLRRPDELLGNLWELRSTDDAESHDTLELADGRMFDRYSRPQWVGGVVVGRVWSFRDVTSRVALERRLVHQALHDPLTGLANKTLFDDRLEHAIARVQRSGRTIGVLFLDVDNFKEVNDGVGHHAGDELLRHIAACLSDCARRADTVARLGGDEFAVLMEELTDSAEPVLIAERVLASVRAPLAVAEAHITATVSIGVTLAEPGMGADELLRAADVAMYRAKEAGKNRYALLLPMAGAPG